MGAIQDNQKVLYAQIDALAAENARLREALETTAHELRVRNRYSLQHGAYLLAVEVLASVGVEWARAALTGEA